MRLVLVALLVLLPAVNVATQMTGKDSRTPAQRKISSPLLQEIERRSASARSGVDLPKTSVKLLKVDARDRVLVDVRVDVTDAIRKTIVDLGSVIVSTSNEYRSVVAWIPIAKLETLAEDDTVRAIVLAPEPVANPH